MGRKPVASPYIYYRGSNTREAVRKVIATGQLQHIGWSSGTWWPLDESDCRDWELSECLAQDAYNALPDPVRARFTFDRLFGAQANG